MLSDKELKDLKEKLGSEYTTRLGSWAGGSGFGIDFAVEVSPLKIYSVYRHFTKFNNRWYLTEWANDRTLLIRCEAIEAVRSEEKKDESNIPCPVVHSWMIPKDGDPYGVCVGDLARDNQISEQLVMNLLVEKIHEDTFSGTTVFDPSYIDGNELAKKKIGKRQYIPAKAPLNNKIIENVQTQTSSSSDGYNLKNLIDAKGKREV